MQLQSRRTDIFTKSKRSRKIIDSRYSHVQKLNYSYITGNDRDYLCKKQLYDAELYPLVIVPVELYSSNSNGPALDHQYVWNYFYIRAYPFHDDE